LFGAWQFVHFGWMVGESKTIAVLLKAEIYWPRSERLTHRTSHDNALAGGRFSSFVDERKLMKHFVEATP
jgi:hypothetical protein